MCLRSWHYDIADGVAASVTAAKDLSVGAGLTFEVLLSHKDDYSFHRIQDLS
jgi:hypothetical protein